MPNATHQKKVVMTVSNEFTTDYRVFREARALVDAGYDVTLFCVYKKGLARSEEKDGIHVRRILDAHIRLPVSAQGRRVRKVWWKHLLEARADLYHAHDRDTLDLTARVARKLGVPFIYDSHEYWPDKNAYENNTRSLRDRLSEKWWNAKERRYISWASGFIVTSPGHGDGLVKRYGVQPPTLVRNIPEFQRGTDRTKLRKRIGLSATYKLLVYVGNIQRNRGIEEIIASLVHLPSHVHFAIIGYGHYQKELESRLPANLRSRVHFIGQIPFTEIIPLIYSADIGVAPFQANCYSHRHVLPNKIFEYMMAELPIAASAFPDMKNIIDAVGYGNTFDPASPSDIARVLNELLRDKEQLEKMRERAKNATEKTYRWDKEKDNLLNLYKKLLP